MDDETSIRSLLHAFERGINFVDTAEYYSDGHSEEVIGEASGWGEAPLALGGLRIRPRFVIHRVESRRPYRKVKRRLRSIRWVTRSWLALPPRSLRRARPFRSSGE